VRKFEGVSRDRFWLGSSYPEDSRANGMLPELWLALFDLRLSTNADKANTAQAVETSVRLTIEYYTTDAYTYR
jgi:hypothetical protein